MALYSDGLTQTEKFPGTALPKGAGNDPGEAKRLGLQLK